MFIKYILKILARRKYQNYNSFQKEVILSENRPQANVSNKAEKTFKAVWGGGGNQAYSRL